MNPSTVTELPTIAGYRPLRVIGRGRRGGEVWLGIGDDGSQVALTVVSDSGDGIAALGREVAALDRAAGDHVVRLLDLDLTPATTVMVFERLAGGDLADMLSRRPELAAGEAVTILAPLALTVDRLHASGVAHGGLHPGRVLFRSDGAPVITGFGTAMLFAENAPEVVREAVEGVAADRAALISLAVAVLGRVAGPRAKVAVQLSARIAAAPPAQVATLLATAVFELATPLPVSFAAPTPEVDGDPATAGRVVPVTEPADGAGRQRVAARTRAASRLRAVIGPDGSLASVLERGPSAGLRAAAASRWSAWSSRRRRGTLAVTAALLALVVAGVMVPDAGPSEPGLPVAQAGGGATPDSAGEDAASDDADAEDARLGDDPLVATAALLELRARCFIELSLLCLDEVDQQGSAALEDDQAAVAAVLAGGELPPRMGFDPAVAVVTERLGDSALVSLGPDSASASLLVMRGEAGWRIRDYIAVE